VQVGPKSLPVQECPKLTVPECPKPAIRACATYELPGIAETVTIKIRGNVIEADAGGEQLIRNYARAQSLLR
jgi:hypothetical protein